MRSLLLIATILAACGLAAQTAPAAGPLDTGFVATADFLGPDADLAFTRAREAGASFIRIYTSWAKIAPAPPTKGSNARDPANPGYDWTTLDEVLNQARAHKLQPIVDIVDAPGWAWGKKPTSEPGAGPLTPSVKALAAFTAAMANRYSGTSPGISRVKYWQLWNEPNLTLYLKPQFSDGKPFSPSWYRAMTNAFYTEIHAARADNSVIAGGLSPFTIDNEYYVGMGPLKFMRTLLCMSAGAHPHPTCGNKTSFDIWAHHPYTSGGPTHEALNPDDVSLGDLPEMKNLLDAAVKAGHVVSNQKVRFWVTEFSWDSQPGDAKGVPLPLHARWIAEGLYRMWQSGVSLVTWFNLRDDAFVSGPNGLCQCGLWLRGPAGLDKAMPKKQSLQAFRFPFVAFNRPDGSVWYWGRTPDSNAAALVIEQKIGRSWVTLSSSASGNRGIFVGTATPRSTTNAVRARILSTGDASVPFSLVQPPDLPICAFGTC